MKYILLIVLLLIGATTYFVLRPEPTYTVTDVQPESQTATETNSSADAEAATEKQRRVAMQAVFDKLDKSRRNLEAHLNRVKALIWGKQMPKEQADLITKRMKDGYFLLKNKKLMGAYTSADEIQAELDKVTYIDQYLTDVEKQLREQRDAKYQ